LRGSVRKVKIKTGQRWEAVVDVPSTDGRRQQRRRFRTKTEADPWLAEVNHSINTGAYIEPAAQSLGAYLTQWLQGYGEANLRQSTLEGYTGLITNHVIPILGNIPLGSLTPMHLQQLYEAKLRTGRLGSDNGGLAPSTVRQIHAILHRALKLAMNLQLIRQNPADAVIPPKPQKPDMRYLSPDEARALLTAADDDRTYYPLYHMAILTGLRRGELLALRWSDIDLERRSLTVTRAIAQTYSGELVSQPPKTAKGKRTIALSHAAVSVLRNHKRKQAQLAEKLGDAWQGKDLVMSDASGGIINPSNIHRHFKRLLRKAGVKPIRFHDLRHTHATLMLKQGEHPKVVSERLGHNSIQITLDTYTHVLPNLQKEAADKLDATLFGPEF